MQTPAPHKSSPSPGAPQLRRTGTARSKYTLRACQECRRRRAKCDGHKPSCSRCLDRGLDCVFSTNIDHRGSAPRSYVSLLQNRISLLEQVLQIHSIDVDLSLAQVAAQNHGLNDEPPRGSQLSSPSDAELQHDPGSTPYSQDALGGPEYRGCDAPFFGATSGRLDLSTNLDTRLSDRNSEPNPDSTHHLAIAPRPSIQSQAEVCPQPRTRHTPHYRSVELQEHLIDVYFEWEQPWLQVVDEALFRDSRRNNGRYYSALLLDCMLALASRYSERTEARSDPRDPNTAGMIFIKAAESRLQSELTWPRITTVQSLAIMAIFYVAVGSDAAGWLHHGMAIRLILDMGLNIDPTTETGLSRLLDVELQLRRQIYWSLYCSDKLWASYTGRICTMLDSQGSVPLMESTLPSNGLHEPSSLSDPKKIFLALFLRFFSTQCQILERVLTNLYAPKGLEKTQERCLFFDNCFLDLQSWFFALPKELKAGPDQPNASPHVYLLNMCFHTCIILLAKPFLPKRSTSTELDLAPDSNREQLALGCCRQASKDICYLSNRYRAAFGSFRRSPLTATHCTLTAALMALFLTDGNRGDLTCCVTTLGELADSWTPAKRYWQTLSRVLRDNQVPKASQTRKETAKSGVTRHDVDVGGLAGISEGSCPVGLPLDMSSQWAGPMDSRVPQFADDVLEVSSVLDFSQLDLDQLDLSPLVLPFDYMGYNAPSFDFQWFPQN
ncbi:hypothetical protein NM208_g790 [Fusarium decemcellulare]|uniref:Uncharacterized protein n=1 Tax=Fusarium decemcellulare TaxID=57161 RepID=A0ACC1SYM6_9HYPO|nr:hypothetical protein NM208_g790 [Fusarium decemcellulare]